MTCLVYGFVIFFRARYLREKGLPIYWLEELWAPTGFLALVVVTFAEKLVSRGEPPKTPRARPKK